MAQPVEINFHNMDSSPALTELIDKEFESLKTRCPQVERIRVVIEEAHKHSDRMRPFSVQVHAYMREDSVVTNNHTDEHAPPDAYQAVRNAFSTLEKELHRQVDKKKDKRRRAAQ